MPKPAPVLLTEDPATSATLPARAYTDPDIFRRELTQIFHRSWQYAGAAGELARAGDFITVQIADQTIAVIRGDDGILRAFHNVCRHRGHTLLDGSGQTNRIVCPYHAWSYDSAGRLLTARGMERSAGFNADCLGLKPVRVEVLADKFVFVNLDQDAVPLATVAAGLLEDMRREVPDFDVLAKVARPAPVDGRIFPLDTTIRANWKIVVDNCLECYHCRPLHPAFRELIDMASFKVEAHDNWATFRGQLAKPEVVPATARNRNYRYWWLWPNTFFEMSPGGAHGISVGSQQPVDITCTRQGRNDRYGVPGAPLFEARGYGDLNLVPEDREAMESVQRGMHSLGYDAGRFGFDPAGGETSEAAVHRFQWLVAKAVGLA